MTQENPGEASWWPVFFSQGEQRVSIELCSLGPATGPEGTAWSGVRGRVAGG